MAIRQITESAVENVHAKSNLAVPAQVHITVMDEDFPADAGSVTPPAP